MKKITMLKLRPSIVEGVFPSVELSVVELERTTDNSREMLDFCYKEIGCDLIEYATFGNPYDEANHYNAIVDEEGLLKSGNVAMRLTLPIDGEKIQLELCGTVLLSKSKLVESEGLEEAGLESKDIEYIKNNLNIKVIGVTR